MRDLQQQMMRASTSFAEGTFTTYYSCSLKEFKRANFASSAAQSAVFPLFLGVRLLFYPPLLLSKTEEGEELLMFLWTRFSARAIEREEERRARKSFFISLSRERERERSESLEYVFFFLSIIDLFFFPFVLERTKNAQKKNRFRPDDDREKTRRILLPVLLLAE